MRKNQTVWYVNHFTNAHRSEPLDPDVGAILTDNMGLFC
jgi:hypothetical protein